MAEKLDRLDMRLLACLQRDNIQTADQLAEQVGRSPSAVARRLRRLRASDAIAAENAILSEKAAGFPLTAMVLVQFERHSASDVGRFVQGMRDCDNVQICLELAGSFDVLLIVVAATMEAYNDFTNAMLKKPPVLRFETTFVKKRAKATLAVPLDHLL